MKTIAWLLVLLPPTGLALRAPGAESYESVPPAVTRRMEETRSRIMAWLGDVDAEAFPPGKFLARDKVLLKSGQARTGKILDYGPFVCLLDAKGRTILPRGEIKKMTASWPQPAPKKPAAADLDVTYIERLPRYRSNHANVGYDPRVKGVFLRKPNSDPLWPPDGAKATFKAHVVNKGPVASKPFRYAWLIDGKEKAAGRHAAIHPRQEVVIAFPWRWRRGRHTVTCRVTPGGEDFSAWNNRRTDRTDSLGFCFVASRSTYDGFDGVLNMVESYSYEDWIQLHLQVMNFLFAASIHPGSPEGCFERVRVDQMATYADKEYREKFERAARDEEGYMLHEGRWGFSPWDRYGLRAAGIDWGLIHELGHQLGIIDYYTLDFWRYVIHARDRNGLLIDVGYSYPATGMMRGHGPHVFTEATAIAMNWERGRHRGFYGDYLFRLPAECGLRILSHSGVPIPGAAVRIFRRAAGVHTLDKGRRLIPEKPVFEGRTGADGVFMLPNEKPPFVFTTDNGFTRGASPFGEALVISDTGLLLIEVWTGDRRDVQFTDVTQFMIGRGRGHEKRFVKDIATILPSETNPVKPPKIVSIEPAGWCDRLRIGWANVADNPAVKFRIYTFRHGLPFQRMYRSQVATVNAHGPFALSVLHLNGWVTMTGIDAAGNESAPAVPRFVTRRHFGKLDADSKSNLYTAGEAVFKIDQRGDVHPVPTRTWRGYLPAAAVAIGGKDELFLLGRELGVVAVLGQDSREKFHFGKKGSGEGQLSLPGDLDVDREGNVYVADTANDRIAVFGPKGTFLRNLGVGKLGKPVAVEVDVRGNVYVIQSKKPGLTRIARTGRTYGEPETLVETKAQPTALTSDAAGRVYVSQAAKDGLIVLGASGKVLARLARWREKDLTGITGMVMDRRGLLNCAIGNRGEILRIPLRDVLRPAVGK